MNLLDVGILLLLVLLIWLGYTQQPIRQASASIGAIAGLLLGSLLYRRLAFLTVNSFGRTIVLGLLIIAAGCFCYDIILSIGRSIERKTHAKIHRLTLRARIISSTIAATTGIVIIWLTLGIFSTLNSAFAQGQLNGSVIVSFAERHTSLPSVFQNAAALLTPFNAPKTFVGTEPTFDDNVTVSRNFSELDTAVASASKSVFKVSSWGCGATTIGSSFMISDRALVTNAHVIAGATRISVQDKTTGTNYVAQPIWFDPSIDMAVLSVSGALPQKPLAFHTGTVYGGDIGSVLGYPGGEAFSDSDAIILQSLDAKGYDIYQKNIVTRTIYALRATVVPGNSGGPLIDTSGKVLGLVFGHSTTQNHTGYALTAQQIEPSITAALKQNSVVSSGSCEM
jgi:S1-C subfamily serine protease